MSQEWLHKQGCSNLVVLCNGWGMDGAPFRPLSSLAYDVLVLSDYTSHFDVEKIADISSGYQTSFLLGWSMGVSMGHKLFIDYAGSFSQRIAINGTLRLVDERFGIPPHVFQATLKQMDEYALQKFYRRMCREQSTLDQLYDFLPKRTMANTIEELQHIGHHCNCPLEETPLFTQAVISRNDYIIPTTNQIAYWKNNRYSLIEGYHFPFYQRSSWDDLIEMFMGNEKMDDKRTL